VVVVVLVSLLIQLQLIVHLKHYLHQLVLSS
jgi:hypothetical protein